MAFMQSCCCWRSVRRGSFACAIYTGIYFLLLALTTGNVLRDEHQYMWGNRSLPESMSFLEAENMSHVTFGFYVSLFVCSCCGIVSSLLLLLGLFKDRREYLVPWIVNVAGCSSIDVAHTIYLFVSQRFEPITALIYTLDFFLLCINVYSLLCVISQYQEYVAGRGRAIDDLDYRIPVIRYVTQPTATSASSCLSARRALAESGEGKGIGGTNGSAEIAENGEIGAATTLGKLTPTSGTGKSARKHVQFPDQKRDSISNNATFSTDDNSATQTVYGVEKEDARATPASAILSGDS